MIGELTIDDRDAIDAAQGRIRRLSALVAAIEAHREDPLEVEPFHVDARNALGDILALIYEDAVKIDDVLDEADTRATLAAAAQRAGERRTKKVDA